MKQIKSDPSMVAYCGLYCGACGRYLKDKCPGCHENKKATWCAVRLCCIDNHYATCADCKQYTDPNDCRKFNNVFSKIIGVVLRSDRAACIRQIKGMGVPAHADNMAATKRQSIRRT